MPRARKEVELAVRVGNEPGALGRVLSTVASAGVNILAYCSYSERQETVVLLVADNPLDAKRALGAAGFSCKANLVVLVGAPDQVGGAAFLGARLGYAGIDILYSYASSSGSNQFFAVFKTGDDQKAIHVLEGARASRAQAA
jgi:hypothetical protein